MFVVKRFIFLSFRYVKDMFSWYYERFIVHPLVSIPLLIILGVIYFTNSLLGYEYHAVLYLIALYILFFILKWDILRLFVFIACAGIAIIPSAIIVGKKLETQKVLAEEILLNSEGIVSLGVKVGNRVKQKGAYQILWGRSVSGAYIYMQVPRYPDVVRGSTCTVTGRVQSVEDLKKFGEYIRNNGSYLYIKATKMECEESAKSSIYSLYRVKDWVVREIEKHITEPNASLLVGIMFGDDRVYTEDFQNRVRVTGLTHIVAASGYNISFVSSMFQYLFILFPFHLKKVFSGIGVGGYVFIAGGSASVVRALGSYILSSFGNLLGLLPVVSFYLVLLVSLMVLINPLYIYDIGFQLSVLATLAIVLYVPALSSIVKVSDVILIPFMCSVLVSPVLATSFGESTVISTVTNALALGSLEYLMLSGVIFSIVAAIFPVILPILSFAVNVQFSVLTYVVGFFSSFRFAVVNISPVLSTMMVLLFTVVVLVAIRKDVSIVLT